MTREELIDRWKTIASAVFWAENEIIADWKERLMNAKEEGVTKVADEYLEAIATEIINGGQITFEDE